MTIKYPDPPTFTEVMVKGTNGSTTFNPLWIQWFTGIIQFLNTSANAGAANHNTLAGLQGGQVNEYFHFTSAQHNSLTNLLTSGFNGTIALAKLTSTGTNGSLTFANGLLTSAVAPT